MRCTEEPAAAFTKMDPRIVEIFKSATAKFEAMDQILAAWYFGSIARGLSDEYSDFDPVYLVRAQYFAECESWIHPVFEGLCESIVLVRPEDFNCEALKTFGLLLKQGGELFQFDVFFMNDGRLDNPFARFHYQGLGSRNVIFDKTGRVAGLLDQEASGISFDPGAVRGKAPDILASYVFHLQMSGKYFRRADILKLQTVRQRLFYEHARLLLLTRPPVGWGSPETQLRLLFPIKELDVLSGYILGGNISEMTRGVIHGMEAFFPLARSIYNNDGTAYPDTVESEIRDSLRRRLPRGMIA
jgi:hypothetical protein